MELRDALFVINQDASLVDIEAACQADAIRSAMVLTTHRLFPCEQEKLRRIAPDVKIGSFADLLSEEDACHSDRTAERVLSSGNGSGTECYNFRFMELSLIEKNRIASERLATLYQFRKVYYLPGLGVAAPCWEDVGVLLHAPEPVPEIGNGTSVLLPGMLKSLYSAAREAKNYLTPHAREIFLIREESTTYIFLTTLKRLRFQPDTFVETITLRQRIRKSSVVSPLVQMLGKMKHSDGGAIDTRSGNKHVYCTTIHGYDRALAKELGGVMVFVDGYHPSNFPRSYLDSYGNEDSFVVRTMLDDRWFTAHGKRTIKPPSFLQREYFSTCSGISDKSVLVALNHAGDWTSLINRSDTDDLVAATVEMARALPEVSFRVRMHPTMNHPAHEGLNSSRRIESFIHAVHLPNLHTSTASLENDLSWCEICLSEYSQVLLDGLRSGKLGVAVNLTRRRSFMQDYADLGFFHASGIENAVSLLKNISEDPLGASRGQNMAVDKYNTLLSRWLDS